MKDTVLVTHKTLRWNVARTLLNQGDQTDRHHAAWSIFKTLLNGELGMWILK